MSQYTVKSTQRYSLKALMDFSNRKAKKWCEKCDMVFLAEEGGCPECKSEGDVIIDGRFT